MDEKAEFYSSLDSILCEIPKMCEEVILGDYNVQIRHGEWLALMIGDMYNINQLSNINGCKLIDLVLEEIYGLKALCFHTKRYTEVYRGHQIDSV